MLFTDTFTQYCKNLNNNMGTAIQYALDMEKKYPRQFLFQMQNLRQKFTTNTQDDYGPAIKEGLFQKDRWIYQHPFYDMVKLIYDQNLLPKFFEQTTLDYLYQQKQNYKPGQEPDLLLNTLAWTIFDEAVMLRQQRTNQLRAEEEARIRAAADRYKRHQQAVQTGKKAMAQIASDPYLSDRFLFGPKVADKNAAQKQRKKFAKNQMAQIVKNPLLRVRFVENSIWYKK